MNTKKTAVKVYITPDERQKLNKACLTTGLSISSLLRLLILKTRSEDLVTHFPTEVCYDEEVVNET